MAPSSRGLGRRPLKAVTPVRIRSGLPTKCQANGLALVMSTTCVPGIPGTHHFQIFYGSSISAWPGRAQALTRGPAHRRDCIGLEDDASLGSGVDVRVSCGQRHQVRGRLRIAIWEWTLRSGRTCTSSPGASICQPLSPSSCSEAMTTEAVRSSSGTCTEDVALRTCSPGSPGPGSAGRSRMCRACWPG